MLSRRGLGILLWCGSGGGMGVCGIASFVLSLHGGGAGVVVSNCLYSPLVSSII